MDPSPDELRAALVNTLAGAGVVRTDAVRRAFSAVPRELFVARIVAVRGLAAVYADQHLVTQETDGVPTSSSSQPSIMAIMLEALAVRPGDRILEVGLGTGYNAALLSQLAGPGGSVISIDIDADIVEAAAGALRAGGYPVVAIAGDGRRGYPAGAPFDRIIVTASGPRVPRAWWDQLAPGGILVMPLRIGAMQLVATLRRTDGGFRSTELNQGGFMSLRRYGPDGRPVADEDQPVLAVRATVPGHHPLDFFVGSTALGRMSTDAMFDLAASLLRQRPRTATIPPAPAWPVIWHAAMTGDLDRQIGVFDVSSGPRFGLVDVSTGGCSLFAATRSGNELTATAIDTYGDDPTGMVQLLQSVKDYGRRGSPSLHRLAVNIDYGDADAPEWTVRSIPGDEHTLSLGWLPP